MKNRASRFATVFSAALPSLALAHEGHGLDGAHWHATDAWGFVVAGLATAAALWLLWRK